MKWSTIFRNALQIRTDISVCSKITSQQKKFTAFMLVKGKQHNKCITLTHVKLVILSFSVFSFSDDTFLIEKRHDILLIYCFC